MSVLYITERLNLFTWLCRERYQIKLRKEAGQPPPWTEDQLLAKYHFCNVFRSDDSTSRAIYSLLQVVPEAEQLEAAIHCRLVNRASMVRPSWEARKSGSLDDLEEALDRGKINTNAYRVNTPRGLLSRRGIAELSLTPRPNLKADLQACTSLGEAMKRLDQEPYINGFLGYQILLDLLDIHFWPEGFDASQVFVGPGAARGCLYLHGQDLDYGWKGREFRQESNREVRALAEKMIKSLTRRVQAAWPAEWPTFTVHETEFMLCELDKYVRKSLVLKEGGQVSGRLYRSGRSG